MKYGKLELGQIEALVNNLGGMDVVMGILSGTVEITTKVAGFIAETYKQVVNYDLSVAELLKTGRYDWKNEDITDKNFPSTEKGEREIEFGMFHFKRGMSSEDVIAEMKKVGYRPATMKELLTFGKNNPKVQLEHPIVALSSVAGLHGNRRVGCLIGDGSERSADLDVFADGWDDGFRFLAVRN